MKRTLVNLDDEITQKIKLCQKEQKFKSFSRTINYLIKLGLEKDELNKDIKHIINNSKLQISKSSYIINLLEQIYSDFNLDDITDPRKSISLKKFKERINRSEDD